MGLAVARHLRRRRSTPIDPATASPTITPKPVAAPVIPERPKADPPPAPKTMSTTLPQVPVSPKTVATKPVARKRPEPMPEPTVEPAPEEAPLPARVSKPDAFRELLSLQLECLEAYREQAGIPEKDWRDRERSHFVVSDDFEKEPYFDYLMDYLGPQLRTGGMTKVHQALSTCRFPSDLYAKAEGLIPVKERPVKRGSVTTPFEAEIYEIRS